MSYPNWYGLVLLSVAAFRVWRLLSEDTILDKLRNKLLRLGSWKEEGDVIPLSYRKEWGIFIQCSWCLGWWVGLAWWGGYQFSPHWTLIAAVPFAISAVVGALAHALSPE